MRSECVFVSVRDIDANCLALFPAFPRYARSVDGNCRETLWQSDCDSGQTPIETAAVGTVATTVAVAASTNIEELSQGSLWGRNEWDKRVVNGQ